MHATSILQHTSRFANQLEPYVDGIHVKAIIKNTFLEFAETTDHQRCRQLFRTCPDLSSLEPETEVSPELPAAKEQVENAFEELSSEPAIEELQVRCRSMRGASTESAPDDALRYVVFRRQGHHHHLVDSALIENQDIDSSLESTHSEPVEAPFSSQSSNASPCDSPLQEHRQGLLLKEISPPMPDFCWLDEDLPSPVSRVDLLEAASGEEISSTTHDISLSGTKPDRRALRTSLQNQRKSLTAMGCTASSCVALAASNALTDSAPAEKQQGLGKLWCHIFISSDMLAQGFNLAKKVIGPGGQHMKGIFEATGAKIRYRGQGSGHLENGREAPVHLMLAITGDAAQEATFEKAVIMAVKRLKHVVLEFKQFSKVHAKWAESELFWLGDSSEDAQACLTKIEGLKLPTLSRVLDYQ